MVCKLCDDMAVCTFCGTPLSCRRLAEAVCDWDEAVKLVRYPVACSRATHSVISSG